MASIDKIYATKKQRDELYSWCEENLKEALPYFYEWLEEWTDPKTKYPITNFPSRIDQAILDSCPIQWVVDFIKEQYSFDEIDLSSDDYLIVTYDNKDLADLPGLIKVVLEEYNLDKEEI